MWIALLPTIDPAGGPGSRTTLLLVQSQPGPQEDPIRDMPVSFPQPPSWPPRILRQPVTQPSPAYPGPSGGHTHAWLLVTGLPAWNSTLNQPQPCGTGPTLLDWDPRVYPIRQRTQQEKFFTCWKDRRKCLLLQIHRHQDKATQIMKNWANMVSLSKEVNKVLVHAF